MEDNKRDFSDFFKRSEEPADKSQQAQPEPTEDRPSYYYSYGPHKSSIQDSQQDSEREDRDPSVEMTPPRPVRPFNLNGGPRPQPPLTTWTVNEPKRRSSLRGYFAAFLAAAVVISGLMFASDKMNLFTGDKALAGTPAATMASGDGGGLKNAAYLGDRPASFSQIVNEASPAVVLVKSYVKPRQRTRGGGGNSIFNDPFFNYFFGGGGGDNQQQPNSGNNGNGGNNGNNGSGSLQEEGLGSGFIFDPTGYILTNEHVIDGADEVHVVMEGSNKEYTAKVVGSSYDYDLAVLKIEGDKPFPSIPIGSSDDAQIGDWVVAIGNPLGFDHTVTVGVLSAKERSIDIPDNNGTRSYKHLLQTDASINPGNSGGPLLNMQGQVIGINTAVSSQAQGIGFVIPTSTISELLPNLKSGAKIPKPAMPYIGIYQDQVSDQMKQLLGLNSTDGSLVTNVIPGGPAYKAGLRQYDVVTAIDGKAITSPDDLKNIVTSKKVGDKISLTVIRGGKSLTIDITIGDENNDPAAQAAQQQQQQQQP